MKTHNSNACLAIILFFVSMTLPLSAAETQVSTSQKPQTLDPADTRLLLNWASHLSRYSTSERMPEIRYVDHQQLVDAACFGVECRVLGWYNDTDVIYIDQRFSEEDTLFSRSLIVHELIHFLQHHSGEYTTSCLDVSAREAEAYWIQQEYHLAHGSFARMRPYHYDCSGDSQASVHDVNQTH